MPTLTETLQLQSEHLTKLKGLLDQELHLISSRDAEALISLVKEKEILLDQIQETDLQINAEYSALGENIPEAIKSLIQDIKSLVEDCKHKTAVSQKAVEQGQLRLEHLRTLLIESRTKESMTYDKSGRASGMSKGKGISA